MLLIGNDAKSAGVPLVTSPDEVVVVLIELSNLRRLVTLCSANKVITITNQQLYNSPQIKTTLRKPELGLGVGRRECSTFVSFTGFTPESLSFLGLEISISEYIAHKVRGI